MFDIRQSKEEIVKGADKLYALYLKTCAENERLRAALTAIRALTGRNDLPDAWLLAERALARDGET